jgi:hypothetical protein
MRRRKINQRKRKRKRGRGKEVEGEQINKREFFVQKTRIYALK